MNKFKKIVGIDISKNTFDCNVYGESITVQYTNNLEGFNTFNKELLSCLKSAKDSILIAFENTGMYSYNIAVFLEENNYHYVMLPGLALKRSMGIVRGKSDSIDAKHIARYVYEKREIIKTSKLSSTVLIKLKKYLSLRDSLVKSSTGFKANYTESKRVYSKDEYGDYLQILREQINHFQHEINKVEKIITDLINTDDSLKKQYDLLNSIKGLGKVIIPYMLAYTDAFTKFDSARKFASYIGVAPFPHQSGTSIRGKNRTSKLAHRKLNSLLEMGARSAIQFDMELKAYYERKRIEGKEKETVINAVKNKLIARAFAVIKRETPFVDIMKFAA